MINVVYIEALFHLPPSPINNLLGWILFLLLFVIQMDWFYHMKAIVGSYFYIHVVKFRVNFSDKKKILLTLFPCDRFEIQHCWRAKADILVGELGHGQQWDAPTQINSTGLTRDSFSFLNY